jgi:ribosomal protein S13
MDNKQYSELIEFIGERFDSMQNQIDEMKVDIKNLLISNDNIIHSVKNISDEMHISNYRLDRFEDWAKVVGEKTGVLIRF